MTIWVADADSLIFLAKLGRLNLLSAVGGDIYIPSAVMAEIRAKGDEACAQVELAGKSWLRIREVENRETVVLLLADLDPGESEVITLAKEIHADYVILDDLDARRFARRVGLSVIGTVGILLSARLRGEIPSLRDEIGRLQAYAFRISQTFVEEVLKEAGE